MTTSPDRQIAQWIVEGIQRRLNDDQTQVFPCAVPDFDPAWQARFIIEVQPGPMQPYGDGDGAQDGGALLREQTFTLWGFWRANLDQFSKSVMLLIEAEQGILDRFEVLRQLFSFTQFPTITAPTTSDFALLEPVRWRGESATQWEDAALRIVRRSMTLVCRYGVTLPDAAALMPPDYL